MVILDLCRRVFVVYVENRSNEHIDFILNINKKKMRLNLSF